MISTKYNTFTLLKLNIKNKRNLNERFINVWLFLKCIAKMEVHADPYGDPFFSK